MVRFLPLGGLGEVGMNCMAIVEDGHALIVDCGVTFDDAELGVDVIHPDFRALDGCEIDGLVITHGHEDHIGAIPYFLRRFDVPVYGPRYALGLVRARADEHEVLDHARLIETVPRKRFSVGHFSVEPVRVTHSIVDATALAIETKAARVLHTGDFKFDDAPPDGQAFDVARLAELGKEGVDVLLSDSTNAEVPGISGSESDVREPLSEIVRDARGAVIVAMFASNVHRLRILGDIAIATGRKLVLLGRSVALHTRLARSTGFLEWPDDLVWPDDRATELPRERVLAIVTGSQGEPQAALARLARGDHSSFAIARGDTVVFSSRAIPGNEPIIHAILAGLLRRGANVRTQSSDRVHVSGHAQQGEQRRMIDLTEPRGFLPVHGTLHLMTRHADIARDAGVREVTVIENGVTASWDGARLVTGEPFSAGRVHVCDGREIPHGVLGERRALAQDGVAAIAIELDAHGSLARDPSLVTRGVACDVGSTALSDAVAREVREALSTLGPPPEHDRISEAARLAARRAIGRVAGKKPVTLVSIASAERTGDDTPPKEGTS